MIVAGAVAAAGLGFATAAPASATGGSLSTTISQWSSADFALNDAKHTKLTVAAGVDQTGIIGRRLTTTKTVSVKLNQSYCKVVSGADVLVTRALAVETPVSGGVEVSSLFGNASVKTTVTVPGTETKTPSGTGGDCNEVTGAPVTSPVSEQVKLDIKWSNKRNSSPVVWGSQGEQGLFYYRDATATGKLGSTNLGNSTSGWLWSGIWVYATA